MQTFTYESKSGGKPHTTRVHPDGRIVCTCRGFSSPNKCWHVRDVAAKLGPRPVQTTIDLQDVDRNQPHWMSHPADTVKAAEPLLGALFGAEPSQVIVDDPTKIDPMLAMALPEGKTIADYETPEYVLEEKIDGHRLIVKVSHDEYRRVSIVAWSRAGNVRDLPPHLLKVCAHLAAATYDTEIDVPGGTSTDVTAKEKQHLLRLTLFDLLRVDSISVMDKPGTERRALLEYAASEMDANPSVRVIKQCAVNAFTLKLIYANGGEGAVIKRRASRYQEGRRSSDWIKFKKPEAMEVIITGFEEGKSGPHSTILGVARNGIVTKCKSLNDAWRAEFKNNADAYIGKTLVVSHFGLAASKTKYKSVMADHILGAKL